MLPVYETVAIGESASRLLSVKIIQELSVTVGRLSIFPARWKLPSASMYQQKQSQLII